VAGVPSVPSSPRDVEREVDGLLSSLGYLHRQITHKVALVGMDHEMSRTHFGLGVHETPGSRPGLITFEVARAAGLPTELWISAHVDLDVVDLGRVQWTLDIVREGLGWHVERKASFSQAEGDPGAALREFTPRFYGNSAALADALPSLTDELLDVPLPSGDT
jgi:hypothetical protein